MKITINEQIPQSQTLIRRGTLVKLIENTADTTRYNDRIVVVAEDYDPTSQYSFAGFCLIDADEIGSFRTNAFEPLTGSVTLSN